MFFSRLLSSGSLVLLSPSTDDEGYFECTAVNDAGEERRVIEVLLRGTDTYSFLTGSGSRSWFETLDSPAFPSLVPPSIEDDATAVTAVKMSSAVLPCRVQGRPQPTVTWTKGGAKLGSRGGSYRVLPTGRTSASAVNRSGLLETFLCLCLILFSSLCFQHRRVGDYGCSSEPRRQIHVLSPQPSRSGSQTHDCHSAR